MSHARVLCVLLTLIGLTLTGCATENSKARRGQARLLDVLVQPDEALKLDYDLGWATDLGIEQDNRIASVTPLGDLVIVVEWPSNMVTAVQARDGAVRWRRIFAQSTDRILPPKRTEDTLYISSERQLFNVRPENGHITNVANLGFVAAASPVLQGSYAIYGNVMGRVVGHDIGAGYTKWAYALKDRIIASPTLVGYNAFVADATGNYALVDGRSGELLWRGYVWGPVVTSAAVDRTNVYLPSTDRSLYAFDRVSGADRWIYRSLEPLDETPATIGLNVYQPVDRVGLVALSSTGDGEPLWTLERDARALLAFEDEDVLAWTPASLLRLNPQTGQVLAEAATRPLLGVEPLEEQDILLVSPTGRLLRLNAR